MDYFFLYAPLYLVLYFWNGEIFFPLPNLSHVSCTYHKINLKSKNKTFINTFFLYMLFM